jgi:hypothetical protein
MEDRNIQIVRFRGEELTLEEARSGAYVFAVGTETDTIYAFETRPAESRETVDDLMTWARERGLEETLHRGRARLAELGDAPVDSEVEAVDHERVQQQLIDLADETGKPPGRDLFTIAEERGIFGSVLLFSQTLYRVPRILVLKQSSPDLAQEHNWYDTLSCFNFGHPVANLYEQTGYGPNRAVPLATVPAFAGIKLVPNGGIVGSVLF